MVENRKILITGATRGLGRALVNRFTEMDHIVFGCGRSETDINTLSTSFTHPNLFHSLNVSEWEQVAEWAQYLIKNGNIPEILINNAAIMNQSAPLWEISDSEFQEIMDINIGGTANVIRAFLPAMIQAGRGIVVNISSGWGRSTAPNVAPYCTSKWAIEGLTKALAQELPAGLAAVAVNPGVIDTDMLRICWPDSAGGFQSSDKWSYRAAKFFLGLSAKDNGKSLSI